MENNANTWQRLMWTGSVILADEHIVWSPTSMNIAIYKSK